MKKSTTLGVIATNRNFFADSLVADGRKAVLDRLAELGVNTIVVDESTTNLGAVETWADAQKCAALFKQHQDEIDGVLVTLPNFGDEKGVADALASLRPQRAGVGSCFSRQHRRVDRRWKA